MKKNTIALFLWISILLTGCGQKDPMTVPADFSVPAESGTDAGIVEKPKDNEPSSEASPEIPPTAAPDTEPAELTLLMVGDILLHTPVEESALQPDGSYRFDALFAHTSETIQAADLALVNQEVIIGGEALGISGYPCFNAPFSMSDALVSAGFDVVCHATNHALDKGAKGVLACCENWSGNHPETAVLGIHASQGEADSGPFLYTVQSADQQDAFTVAILNYTYGTNGIALPKDMPFAVDLLEKERVVADLKRADELADFTIVCPHWGTEYRLTPDSQQEKWTEIFLENGVDLVLGTHPHVIEPIEWVRDEETGQEMLVYYSLGNYVNWTSSQGQGISNRMVGGMAEVTLTLGNNDNVVISDYGVTALVCHLEPGTNGVTTYFLSDYTEELACRNAILSQDADFSLEYCVNLCDTVWGKLWK